MDMFGVLDITQLHSPDLAKDDITFLIFLGEFVFLYI